MRLHIAPCTIRYLDHGKHLEDVRGIIWIDADGYPSLSFERGVTVDDKRAEFRRFEGLTDHNGEPYELVVCPHVIKHGDLRYNSPRRAAV